MKTRLIPRRRTIPATTLLFIFSTAFAFSQAIDKTWDGGGLDNNWSTPANWDAAVVAGDSLTFAGSTRTSPVNDLPAGTVIGGITIAAGAAPFTITGNAISLAGNIISNPVTGTQSVPLDLGMEQVLTTVSTAGGGTLSLGGVISGTGSITKTNPGRLVLSGANTFTGAVTVASGTLRLQNNSALGATTGTTTISAGATLDVSGPNAGPNGLDLGLEQIFVIGSGVNGQGAIVSNYGQSQSNALQQVTLGGDTTFGGTGPWTLPGANPGRWDIRGTPATAFLSTGGQPFNVSKAGTNEVRLAGITVDPALANIDVQAGTLVFEGGVTSLGNPDNTLTVHPGATLGFSSTTSQLNKKFNLIGDGVTDTIYDRNGDSTMSGPVTLTNDCLFRVQGNGGSLTCVGPIGGSGSLTKKGGTTGGSSLILTGANTYTGNTLVSLGTLALTGNGSISNSATITVAAGATLNASGRTDHTLTLGTGQTLKGDGTITGSVTVAPVATLAPGDNAIGTLAVSGDLTLNGLALMEINRSSTPASDMVSGIATVTYGGTLTVVNTGAPLQAGDSFTLFLAANHTGSFANIYYPPLVPDLVWDTSGPEQNGSISVTPADPGTEPCDCGCEAAPNLVQDGSFELPPVPADWFDWVDQILTPWRTTEASGEIELWNGNFMNLPSQDGQQHLEIPANEPNSTVYQDITSLNPLVPATLCFRYTGRPGANVNNSFRVVVTDMNGATLLTQAFNPPAYDAANGGWRCFSRTLNAPPAALRIAFVVTGRPATDPAVGAHIDNVSLRQDGPVITCPADISTDCQNDDGAFVDLPLPTAVSPCCPGPVQVTCVPASGWFPIGVTPVICTATDACGMVRTCTFTVTVIGHGPAKWEWARKGGGTGADSGKAVAVDAGGNVFVTGSFSRTMTFPGSIITLTATGVAPAQGIDIFVAKYNKAGTLLWAVRAGSNLDDAGQGITVDAAGNAFVTGAFRALGSFAAFPSYNGGNTPTITSAGGSDIFVAKYDPSGQCLWAVADGGAGDDYGAGIAWAPVTDRVVVVGAWGAGSGLSPTQQAYVREFTGVSATPTPGAVVLSWSLTNDPTQSAKARAVAIGSNDRAYLTGIHRGDTNFPLAGGVLDAAGNGKMFIVSYAPGLVGGLSTHSGHPLAVGGMDGLGIAVSATAVYATGNFTGLTAGAGVADFGSGVWSTNAKAVAGGAQLNDFAIVKLDLTLIPQWIRKGGDTATFADLTSNDETRGLSLDPAGNVYVTGFRRAAAPHPFVNEGATMLAASYDIKGDQRWTNHASDTGTGTGAPEDIGMGLAVDDAGCMHVTGDFNEELSFPNSMPPTLSQTNASNPTTARDMFVAKMCPTCCGTSRNLVQNGSFEDDAIPLNSSLTAAVTGWAGTNASNNTVDVELWNGSYNTGTSQQMSPQHLQQHMEINGDVAAQTVSQTVTGLATNQTVTFSFWYVGRPDYNGAFSYELVGSPFGVTSMVAPAYTSASSWQQRTVTFLPTSSAVTISFRGHSTQQAGAHIDNVSLVQDCPETDNDGDGVPNLWEVINRLDPNNPADAAQDKDGDGVTNGQEYSDGTDPCNPNSHLILQPGGFVNGDLLIRFDAIAGRAYTVEHSPTLAPGSWSPLVAVPVQPISGPVGLTVPATGQRDFFRVRTP